MSHRPFLLLTVAAMVATLVPVAGQSRGIAGTVAVEAPIMLLPQEGRTPLATLPEGTRVQVLDAPEEGWYRIAFQDNYLFGDRVGFVRAAYVKVFGRVPGEAPPRQLTPGAAHKALDDEPNGNSPAPRNGDSDADRKPPLTNGAPPSSAAEPRVSHPGPRAGLSDSSIATAIILGQRQRNGSSGLRVLESGDSWTSGGMTAAQARSRFRLEIHTPLAWIQQLASEAAKASQRFTLNDVTDEMTAPVLRIVVYSSSGSWVRHVVLRSDSKAVVVQPVSKEAFSEHVLSAGGKTTVSDGLRVTFPIDAVRKLRGPAGDAGFLVTVTGATGEKKDVRITRTHLAALPM